MGNQYNTSDHSEAGGASTGTSLTVTPGDTSLQATTVTTLTASGTAIFNGTPPFSVQITGTEDTVYASSTWDKAFLYLQNSSVVAGSAVGLRFRTLDNGTSFASILGVASASGSMDVIIQSTLSATKAEKLRLTAAGALSVLTTVTGTQLISTIATGTAPLTVASTTVVSNLNASLLLGSTWASPAAIGSTAAANGTFAVLQSNSSALFNNASVFDYTLNGPFAAITTRNSHTGVSAVTQLNIGNNAADDSFKITVNGGNFSSTPNQVELNQTKAASFLIKTNNTTAFTINSSQQINIVGPLVNASYNLNLVAQESETAGVGSPDLISQAESNKYFDNTGATAKVYHTLPTAVAGIKYTFVVLDSDGTRVTANTGDTIRIGATVSASAGFIQSTTVGSTIVLVAMNATEWVSIGTPSGTWTTDI